MVIPAAFQVAAPFGAHVGGTNPAFWTYSPDTQYDSWMTVGIVDGDENSALGSISSALFHFVWQLSVHSSHCS